MKAFDFSKLANKSWSEINTVAKEVVVEYNETVTAHPKVVMDGIQHLIEIEELKLSECSKVEAVKRIAYAVKEANDIVCKAKEKRNAFLNSEAGKALTAKFEADTEELYTQYKAIENETAKYINSLLVNLEVISFEINPYDARIELSQAGADRVKELDIVYHYAEFDCKSNKRIATDNMEYSFGGVRSKFSADGDDYAFLITLGLFLDDKNLQIRIADILKQSCEKAETIRVKYRAIEKAYNEKVTF